MSLETAIERLAYAVERSQESAAVAELIRQRNDALAKLSAVTGSRDTYQQWHTGEVAANLKLQRRISSLRGVITKMKKGKINGIREH